MLRHKYIDRICCIVLAATLLLTGAFMGAAASGVIQADTGMGYEQRLFDQNCVHTIDIVMDDWEGFIDTCMSEEYAACTVVIDGEAFGNVAIRAKGNTSLSQVSSYGNDRYSFKIEFDHYESGKTYYGLDKLSLNNLIQDKTMMKDYLAYTLMNRMDAAAPLCSYVQINVNGQPWGLYLAVEAVEDSFLIRNYGSDHGELYKPDSLSMGGGRGNGRDFNMEDVADLFSSGDEQAESGADAQGSRAQKDAFRSGKSRTGGTAQSSGTAEKQGGADTGAEASSGADRSQFSFDFAKMNGAAGRGGFGGMGSSDVMLQYTDDDPASYSNIFSSAKTDITEADQARLIEALRKLSEGETLEEKLEAVDAEAVIRYLVVHSFMDNGDSYTGSMIHNYYLYEEDGALSLLPWDYNLSFGAFSMGRGSGSGSGAASSVNSPIDTPVTSGDISTRPILSWIFESEEYTARYHEIYQEFIDTCARWMTEEIARVNAMLAPYVAADKNGFFTHEEFLTAGETLAEYCRLRCESIQGQLNGSVPSTTEAQRTSAEKLIDASHIDLNDMGEFGMGGGRGGKGTEMPGGMTLPEGFDPSAMGGMTLPEGFDPSAMGGTTLPEGFDSSAMGGMTLPEGSDPSQMNGRTPPEGAQKPQSSAQPSGQSEAQNPARKAAAGASAAQTPSESDKVRSEGWTEQVRSYGGMTARDTGGSWMMLAVCAAALLTGILLAASAKSGR